MRRAAPRWLLPLLLLLFGAALPGATGSVPSVLLDGRNVDLGPRALVDRAHAQEEPEEEESILIAPLYGAGLLYRTLAFSPVTAELSDDAGYRAEGGGFAGEDGWAQVGFIQPDALLLPGRTLTLTRPGGEPLELRLPELAAAVDVEADRIYGRAPANATVYLEIAPGAGEALEREATADAAGDWSLDLAGEADLVRGAASGTVTIAASEGALVQASFVDLAADLTLGGSAVRGRATPGGMVEATITRAVGGEQTLGPAMADGNGNVLLAGAAAPLAEGDVVTLHLTSQPVTSAPEHEVGGTLPALSILLDPSADQVGGTAPVSATVTVVADSLVGDVAVFNAVADGTGAWLVDAGETDLGAGWRARASVEAAPGLRAGVLTVVEQLQLGVGIPLAAGRAMPGQPVTVTLRAADGTPRQMVPTVANDQGDYQIFFDSPFSPAPIAPQPGERVEIAFVAGDPIVLNVPRLSAVADTEADAVRGETEPGLTVRARIGEDPEAPRPEVDSGPDGRYTVTFADYDLASPATGVVEIEHFSGNLFYTTWAAVRLTSVMGNTFQNPFVTGTGAPWRRVHIEHLDPEGQVVAEAEGPVFGGGSVTFPGFVGTGPQFFLQPTDITGAPVQMEPGDRLRATVGDAVLELEVPPLDAVVLVQRDTISGRTAPGATVRILVSQTPPAINAQVETAADADGNWGYIWDEDFDLLFGDQIQLVAEVGGHDWLSFQIAPGLLVDLDQSIMLGSLTPDAPAIVALARDGSTLYEERVQTDADGALFILFFDDDGERILLREGDEITVLPLGRRAGDVLRLTVPALDLFWDVDTDAVGGNATAGGSLILLGTNAYARTGTLGIHQAWPAIGADDGFTANFVPAPDVRPGSRLIAIYRPATGNYAVRQRTVPILNAEIEGPNACGFGKPNEEITGDLSTSGGDGLATFDGSARFDGYFAEGWQDGDEELVAARIGQRATVQLTPDEGPAEMTLPGLNVNVDWQTGQISGTGPANTDLYLGGAVPCSQQQTPGVLQINVSFPFTTRTDDEGNFQSGMPGAAFGGGLEVALFDEEDHRAFRQVVPTRAQVFLGEDKVEGRAGPLAALGLRLLAPDGTERGATSVVADVDGAFLGRLVDGASEPVLIAPGDTLRLETAGEPEELVLENVDFDWSRDSALVDGSAPAGRTVVLLLRLEGGGVISIDRSVDGAGRFSFGENDVPPRAAWSMEDVVGVRVVLPTTGGHLLIRQTNSFENIGPGADGRAIFLPWARTGSGGTAAVEDEPAAPSAKAMPAAPVALERPTWAEALGPVFFDPAPWRPTSPWAPVRGEPTGADMPQD